MIATKKYNPKFLSDDELVAAFCVRKHEYQSIIETVRESDGASNQHVIVIGPRGSGKTTLLLRIAVETQKDAALSQRFFPIVFAEESYEIRNCGEFWLECLFHLADQAQGEEADLRRIYDHLQTEQNDRILAASCLAALLDFADRHGKRLLLVVENLNMMFNEIDDDDAIGWGLRHTLQTEPQIMLLASATSHFDAIDNCDKAFYDLLKVITLRPLDEPECHALWQTISGQAPSRDKIRSLQILTGGNPRLLTIVARFGANLSFQALMRELLDLVDEHTEYFKSHVEALPPQERRIYLALADLWIDATTREIAERARLNTNTCSTQLSRLCQRGVVVVTERTPKRKRYYLAERMYNIYYLLRRRRHPDKILEALIAFMVAYYSKEELAHIKTKAMAELSSAFDRQSMEKFVHTLEAKMTLLGLNTTTQLKQQPQPPVTFPIAAASEPSTIGVAEPHPTVATIARAPAPAPLLSNQPIDSVAQHVQAEKILIRSIAFFDQNRPQEALEALDNLLSRCGNSDSPELLDLVAKALIGKGLILRQLQRPQEALEALDNLLSRCGNSDSSPLPEQVAVALLGKGDVLGLLNRPQEALAVYDNLLTRFGNSNSPALLKQVAVALINKGLALGLLNRSQEALEAFDDLLSRCGNSDSVPLQGQVAIALLNKGITLGLLNRSQEALEAFDDLLSRCGNSDSPALLELITKVLCNKGVALTSLQRPQEALAVYDDLLSRCGNSDSPALLERVAKTLLYKGNALGLLNRSQEALEAFDDLLSRCGNSDSPALLELIAKALCNKGATLELLNRPQEALEAFDDLLSLCGNSDSVPLQRQVAMALLNKGLALELLNRPQEALKIIDVLLSRFGGSDSAPLLELVAMALLNKCSIELALQHYETAIATATQLLEATHPTPPALPAAALALRAAAYLKTGNAPACTADLSACLASVHEHNVDLNGTPIIDTLIDFAARFGAKPALDLIEASPMASRLTPLVTALQQELGQNPRVAIEVAEVAKDIRADIAQRRQAAH